MVTRNIKVSDLSGESNASTVKLGADGSWYEVDLTDSEQQELSGLLRAYLEVGRKVAGPPSRRLIPATTAAERAQIRIWARQQGYDVAPRGVIPKGAYRAYIAAHHDQAA
ncbi:Lsr2 family protein [Microbacterium resistens]|uniref:Lsr2 family protein n=1 Tax=Microbacterium resistens TaxID=156977 RepID=A0ABY3RMR6_9MICO|nr:histone-like nucleoid-structuring protein Lsr2 [Microbacterium resistens]UGS24977.1 Lsr2 family protein [Microbacterium resistens]